jgi:tetratricopeptide (TPR) repeat protein
MTNAARSPETVFSEAIEIQSPEERRSYLDRACEGDMGLRQAVEKLITLHSQAGDFLESPAVNLDVTAFAPALSERPGTVIGPYKLLQQIGEGGMGVVFMAEQLEPIQRTVALKIIKPGMDSRQVIARFEAERQAVAMMDHPNIAKVLDAGTTKSGRPYFVMELVKGVPITQFCDEKQLSLRQRLELFKPVCEAVQHAHQKGIIHRDIKPTNVLVAEYDNRAVPKTIDFGVAKATAQKLTERTMFTEFGQVIGTVEYMSPEQAKFNQLDIDTRSDIYSLGVLLYELLTGSTPFERRRLREVAFDEVLRIIREEEPPKPSTRLSTSDTLPSIAANRNAEPARLSKDVSGELDWIVMKCLEKDRNRRYETANGLAIDLQRYLSDEPVAACPPSTVYRAQKFVRRNKIALALAALVLLCLMIAGGSVGWVARDRSVRRTALEHSVNAALDEAQSWYQRDNWPEALSAVKRAEGILATAAPTVTQKARVESWRSDLETVAELEEILLVHTLEGEQWEYSEIGHASYERAFRALGIDVDAQNRQDVAQQIRELRISRQLCEALDNWTQYRMNLVYESSSHKWHKSAEWAKRPVAVARLADLNQYHARVRLAIEKSNTAALATLLESPTAVQLSASTLCLAARELYWDKQPSHRDFALKTLRRAQIARPDDFAINYAAGNYLSTRQPADAIRYLSTAIARRPQSIGVRMALADALKNNGRTDEAIATLRRAIQLRADPYAYNSLGLTLDGQGKLDEAAEAYRKAIELKPDLPHPYTNLGIILRQQGKLEDAEAAQRKAVELRPEVAIVHANLAVTLGDQGKLADAVAADRKAIELDPAYASAYHNLGTHLHQLNKFDDAVVAFRKSIELEPDDAVHHKVLANTLKTMGRLEEAVADCRKFVEGHPNNFDGYFALGAMLDYQGQFDDAMTAHRRAIELKPADSDGYYNLGETLTHKGQFQEAVAAFRKAIELKPDDAGAYRELGVALCKAGNADDALAAYRKAIELNPKFAQAYGALANSLAQLGKLDEAVATYHKAIEYQPDYAAAYGELGDVLVRQEKLVEAAEAYRKENALQPHNATAYARLGQVLHAIGQLDESEAAWEESLRVGPVNPDRINYWAWCLAAPSNPRLRDPTRAIELAKKAIEVTPGNGDYWSTLGVAEYRAGQWQSAIASLIKSSELKKGNETIDLLFLAMAHWRLGHRDEGRQWYDKAVAWMDEHETENDAIVQFRAEANELLGNVGPPESKPSKINPKP